MTGTDETPAPPTTKHEDDRELGYGAVDARPDLGESEAGPGEIQASGRTGGVSGEVAGAMKSGGQSGGAAYPHPPVPENDDGDHAGQSVEGYSGGENPNSTSTKQASHDRSS